MDDTLDHTLGSTRTDEKQLTPKPTPQPQPEVNVKKEVKQEQEQESLPEVKQDSGHDVKPEVKQENAEPHGQVEASVPNTNKRKRESTEPSGEPYDPSGEALPPKAIFHPSFKKTEECAQDIVNLFVSIIDEHTGVDEGILSLRADGFKAMTMPKIKDTYVGVLGITGSGKSSLINSLTSYEFAPKSDAGACTAAPQEFRSRHRQQKLKFAAEIMLKPLNECETMLIDMIKDICSFQEQRDQRAAVNEIAFGAFDKKARTYVDIFYALFCNHEECSSQDAVLDTFASLQIEEDAEDLLPLDQWLSSLFSDLNVTDGKVYFEADSEEELHSIIEPFVRMIEPSEGDDDCEPSPWPLVEVVRIYVDSPLLKTGVVLVDLPGLNDANEARVQASVRYLDKLEFTIVVGDIKRAEDDGSVYEFLVRAYRRRKSGSAIMVCTRSDDIDNNHRGRMRDADAPAKETLKRTNRDLNKVRKDRKSKQDALEKAQDDSDDETAMRLSKLVRELKLKESELDREYTGASIAVRSKKTANALKRNYKEAVEDKKPLQVFCVSNKLYDLHRQGFHKRDIPILSVEATEIPALRSHILGLPSKKRLDQLKELAQDSLPNFLLRVKLSCCKTSLQTKAALIKLVTAPLEDFGAKIRQICAEYKAKVLTPVIAQLDSDHPEWMNHTRRKLEEWEALRWMSGKAFCRRSGYWKVQATGDFDWNAEMLKPVSEGLESLRPSWTDAGHLMSKSLNKAGEDLVDSIEYGLQNNLNEPQKEALLVFLKLLSSQKDTFSRRVNEVKIKVEREFENRTVVTRATTSQDAHNSYFVVAMKPIYKEAYDFSGKGSHKERFNLLRDKILAPEKGPYVAIKDGFKKACEKSIDEQAKYLSDAAMAIFTDVSSSLSRSIDDGEESVSKAMQIRQRLESELPNAQDIIKGRLTDLLEDCEIAERE
ncbi:uncharacterized protein K452DRAFT_340070 [Aplosporella prunicola CBS 121167]|uniref:G domain-containing protein n=1 Tax=Aplosporella prunicola CBS 121167 TaxID=1176127 RepID=A0A6A6B4F0_9PEZI|nr:uncharacterized protein K452DRAFT_340070 [Aplosporella prunicola CBS 121167]KAF2137631.1 hypothetical protein K452DRAFT_340070 [Aplosporella prunicola CBS 121167]